MNNASVVVGLKFLLGSLFRLVLNGTRSCQMRAWGAYRHAVGAGTCSVKALSGALVAATCSGVAWPDAALELAMPVLTPGQEIRVVDPQTGGLGYWTLFLPADYNAQDRWPVLFNFHGLNQQPTLWPFAELTDQEGMIIVGMEYLSRGLAGIDRAAEARNLQRVVAIVSEWLTLDRQRMFIGGFSKGGWHSSQVAERTADLWAGVVILGAGRSASPDASGLKHKRIFIGIGEHDGEHQSAVAAAAYYRALGAEVTFTTFEGIAHSVDVSNQPLRSWLRDVVASPPSDPKVARVIPMER